jgi:GNAT superfamily N-acetyltransferase
MSIPALPEGYVVSTDPAQLSVEVIHGFLSQSYWAKNIPRTVVERMIKNAVCCGVYHQGTQIGFARAITDYATFAYLADVFVLPKHRDRGLAKVLVRTLIAHPDLQGLRRWMLITLDAQGVYEPCGFKPVAHPERHMEIHRPGMYERTE